MEVVALGISKTLDPSLLSLADKEGRVRDRFCSALLGGRGTDHLKGGLLSRKIFLDTVSWGVI